MGIRKGENHKDTRVEIKKIFIYGYENLESGFGGQGERWKNESVIFPGYLALAFLQGSACIIPPPPTFTSTTPEVIPSVTLAVKRTLPRDDQRFDRV